VGLPVGEMLQERLELCRATLDERQLGTRYRDPGGRKCPLEREKQAGLAEDRGAFWTNDRQLHEVPVIARKPRQ
jgi:hypothetical protein